MISLPIYRALNDYTTFNDFLAIPVETFNEIQVVATYSLEEAYDILNSSPQYYTNYTQTGLGGVRVVALSDVRNFLENCQLNLI